MAAAGLAAGEGAEGVVVAGLAAEIVSGGQYWRYRIELSEDEETCEEGWWMKCLRDSCLPSSRVRC